MDSAASGSGFRRAAHALNQHARRVVRQTTKEVTLAQITSITVADGVKAELYEAAIQLQQGADLALSQFVRWWHANYALRVGDDLVVAQLSDETWLAFDVWSRRGVTAGVRPSKPPATAAGDMLPLETATTVFTTGGPTGGATDTAAYKMRVYDKAGNLLGYVPVFASLP